MPKCLYICPFGRKNETDQHTQRQTDDAKTITPDTSERRGGIISGFQIFNSSDLSMERPLLKSAQLDFTQITVIQFTSNCIYYQYLDASWRTTDWQEMFTSEPQNTQNPDKLNESLKEDQ